MSVTRKLAAIMFTDIMGYTALMSHDEERALDILRKSREIQRSKVESFHGIWLKEMGDGVLTQFDNAKDSVDCALAIQKEANEVLEAQIRIGIHLGDVTIENNDIFGDGVNLASRLQDSADPGGIYISESIQNAIKAISTIETIYLGAFDFKNVDYPVRTYAIKADFLPEPSKKSIKRLSHKPNKKIRKLWFPFIFILLIAAWGLWKYKLEPQLVENLSIAILPFEDVTANPDYSVYMSGMQGAFISELGHLQALRVISKTSTQRYKNTELTIPEIAEQLGVDMLVETSVFQVDSLVRMQVKLIRAFPQEEQIWSNTFTKDFNHMLDIYKEITREIAEEIKIVVLPDEKDRLQQSRMVNSEAMAAYLNARSYWGSLSRDGLQKALEYYQLSVDKDPDFAPGYGGIASVWAARQQMGYASREEAAPLIKSNLDKALSLDNSLAESYYFLGLAKVWTDWDWVSGEQAFKNALSINPNFAEAHAYYSHLLMILKRPAEMKFHMNKALDLDPYNPLFQVLQGVELAFTGSNDRAIENMMKLESLAPNNPLIQLVLWAAHQNNENYPAAYEKLKRLLEIVSLPEVVKTFEEKYGTDGYHAAAGAAADHWSLQADNEFIPPDYMFWMYSTAGNLEKAFEWLEIAYVEHDSQMPYTGVNPLIENLHEDDRYQDLLTRLNLP